MTSLFVRISAVVERYRERAITRGVTMLEYVLLAVIVVGVGALLWTLFGDELRNAFGRIGNALRS